MEEKGKLTGWHVLFMLLAFFGVMIAVNVYFLFAAVKSFPGEQVEQSYEQGLRYNETLAEMDRQRALGWQVQMGFEKRENGEARLVSNWYDKTNDPLFSLQVSATIARPASDTDLQSISMSPDGPARYFTDLDDLGLGLWEVELTATSPDGETFSAHKQLVWFGWSADLTLETGPEGNALLIAQWSDIEGAPLTGLQISATLVGTKKTFALKADGPDGRYTADLGVLEAGDWTFDVAARGKDNQHDKVLKTLTWQH